MAMATTTAVTPKHSSIDGNGNSNPKAAACLIARVTAMVTVTPGRKYQKEFRASNRMVAPWQVGNSYCCTVSGDSKWP